MLELRSVSYDYHLTSALRDVSVVLRGPQLIALAGPNGSGKSTLLKLLARVLTPLRGQIEFEGRPLADWPVREYARRVAYLPQDPDPAFPMRAIDVVVSGRAPFLGRFSWESASDYELARQALRSCDAEHLAERYLDAMSGGERKRVFLARILAAKPSVILLDEPLASLDVAHMQQFSELLRDVVDRTGCTVMYASHDLNWAAAYSDRMLVMQNGILALDAPAEEVLQPDVVRRIFGFHSTLVQSDGRGWIVPASGHRE